ncbi:MAG: hypothetical protein WBW88_18615 [Rhodothermales bacterium]
MTNKEAYQKKMEAQLNEWKADIDKLKAKADMQSVDMRREFQEQIRDLRSMQETAGRKLATLKEAGDDAWEDLKDGIDSAWASFGKKLNSAKSRLRNSVSSEAVTS